MLNNILIMKTLKENYLFIPLQVRYNQNLIPNAKLLFGEIANRANEEGKLIIAYEELRKIFRVDKKTIYFWIKSLEDEGYLASDMLRIKKIHYHVFLIGLVPPDIMNEKGSEVKSVMFGMK